MNEAKNFLNSNKKLSSRRNGDLPGEKEAGVEFADVRRTAAAEKNDNSIAGGDESTVVAESFVEAAMEDLVRKELEREKS